jgi:hypothetical protein
MEWARPNELLPPGEREAIARIEAVYEAVDGLSADDLNASPPPRLDMDDRDERLARLEELADGLGRGDLLDEARDELREAVLARFSAGLAYPYGRRPVPNARTEDKAAILAALLDLVAVAVVEDRLDPIDAAVLSRAGRLLLGIADGDGDAGDDQGPDDAPLRPPPSPDDLARSGAPTDADWAEAEHGSTAIRLRDRSWPDW